MFAHFLAVAAGGAIGAGGRFLVNVYALRTFGPGFPWGTFTVNVAGALAMGFLGHWLVARAGVSTEVRLFVLTGILGGFTTFSAYTLDVVSLAERGETVSAALYAAGTVIVTIIALIAGQSLARAIG
ncbi:MAG: fluoride efflux transporter CrcB [Pseudomonadota bacterium]